MQALHYNEWTDTALTLHLVLQMLGKAKLSRTGFAASALPYLNRKVSFYELSLGASAAYLVIQIWFARGTYLSGTR